ncbi:MAG: M1 family aminopeptidase [Isosphaeraceae bacterium]
MSLRRFGTILALDLSYNARRVMIWIWILLLLFFSWSLSTGKARIQSGDSSVGGTKAYITSEFAVTQQLVILTPLIYGFFLAVASGMSVIHDEENRVGELIHATSLRPGEYIWGKYSAVVLTLLAVLAIHVSAMMLFNHSTPSGKTQEFRGPLDVMNYIRPALLFALPTALFFAGISFAIGERSRRPILVFVFPVVVLLACIFFLWDWAPSWLDRRVDRLLMLLDPGAFRWLNETQLKVDRGVQYYNTARVPLDGWIIANRLITLGIGLGAVLYSQWHFTRTLRGSSKAAARRWMKRQAGTETAVATSPGVLTGSSASPWRPLGALGMVARPPGLISGTITVLRAELRELLSSPGLYLFVPLLVLETLGPSLIAVGAFDTPLLMTPGSLASRSLNPLTTMLCLLLLFYTVESLWRERTTRLASISLATPVRTGSILLGKSLANSLVGVVVLIIQFLVSAGALAYQGKVPLTVLPFGLLWGLLLIPTLLLWTSFVMVTLSLTRNRYATYAIALAVIFFSAYRFFVNEMNWVGNWPLWSAVQWSDISILEFDRSALWLNRILALGLALLFIVLTTRLYARRDLDAAATVYRLRPANLLKRGGWLIPIALVPIVSGGMLWSRVDRGFQGESTKKLEKDYWRKNLATYKDWPLPDLHDVDIQIDLEPDTHRLSVKGTYELLNNQEKPLTQIPVTGGLHWESPTWTLDDKPIKPDSRSGLFIVTPPAPIPPQGKVRLGFAFTGTFPKGITSKGGGTNEFILPSAVVLTSFGTSFAPAIGFAEGVGIDDENKYETKEYPDDYFKGQTDSLFGPRRPFKARITVSGPDRLRYNSIGALISEKVEGGRRTAVWESDHPVNFFNVVAGQWEVVKGNGTAVYYHKAHHYNLGEMVAALDGARKHYSEWFMPFPWRELKLSEFPALASYAQGFPTDITFSESIGFLTDDDDTTSAAFTITAHESAHQWWGNMIAPGKGPGGNLLSEGTSHFSTLMLLEQVKGESARIAFARKIEDSYNKSRSPDSERPLVKIDGSRDGDQTVTYDKTGFVLWMLKNFMGRDRMIAGLHEFFQVYHANPDHPVLQDLLDVLRRHASDPKQFDAFTRQWFFEVVVPEYELSDVKKSREGSGWVVTGKLRNIGTGTMPIEVAASQGKRFPKKGEKDSGVAYRDARTTLTLAGGKAEKFTVRCDFEPEEVVVDPDTNVLMLRRKSAVSKL